MIVELSKTYGFEAAHNLPNLPDGHKCRRLHGHSFRFDVTVRGSVDPHTGIFIDYADIKALVEPLVAIVDHNYLNEVPGLENPSSEVIAKWFWDQLVDKLDGLHEIVVRETCQSSCTYRGE